MGAAVVYLGTLRCWMALRCTGVETVLRRLFCTTWKAELSRVGFSSSCSVMSVVVGFADWPSFAG